MIDGKFALFPNDAKWEDPKDVATKLMNEVINNENPDLHFIMNFGYCQDKLDAKFNDLKECAKKWFSINAILIDIQ